MKKMHSDFAVSPESILLREVFEKIKITVNLLPVNMIIPGVFLKSMIAYLIE